MSPYYIREGHYFFRGIKKDDNILGDSLIINPDNLRGELNFINGNDIKSITINPAYFSVANNMRRVDETNGYLRRSFKKI